MLAHGALLRKNFFDAEQLALIAKNFRNAGLPPEEVAMMALAQKVSTQARDVNERDIDELRSYGLTDEEILDVILASAARNFFSKTLDSLNVAPDEIYKELEPELIQLFTQCRPFS